MSLYKLINSLNLEICSRDKMYDNIKIISTYIDIQLSKVKKEDFIQIITGLQTYLTQEANRDRFILPVENDISLFTDIIENSIKFFN